MVKKRSVGGRIIEILAVIITCFTHWLVYYFVIVNAMKSNIEASELSLNLPSAVEFWENLKYVVTYRDYAIIGAFWNSFRVTLFTMLLIVIVASMSAFFLARRKNSRISKMSDGLIVAFLTIPASVVPTYYMLSLLHINNTLLGLILVETATLFPFCTMMYKNFVYSIPREIDEAAILDGCGWFRLFWRIEFPILKPVTASILVLRSIIVFNDFQNAQYYLSGATSSTMQMCVYIFKSAFGTKWAYLFTAAILASIPLIVMYLLFNKQILKGMTTGAVKG